MGVTRRQPSAAQNSNNGSSTSPSKNSQASPSSTMNAANHHLHHHNPVPDAAADIPSPKYVTPTWVKATLLLFCLITVLAWPGHWHPLDNNNNETSVRYVFFYGWLTALSTGLGVLPFALLPDVADYWVGISNGRCKSNRPAQHTCWAKRSGIDSPCNATLDESGSLDSCLSCCC